MVKHNAVIMNQEVKQDSDNGDKDIIVSHRERNKTRSQEVRIPATLPPFHTYGHIRPKFLSGEKFSPPIKNHNVHDDCIQEIHLWLLMQMVAGSLLPATWLWLLHNKVGS